MRFHMIAILGLVSACGGEQPAPEPETKAETKAEEPAKAKAKAKAKAQPTAEEPEVDLKAMSKEEREAYLMKLGEEVYTTGGSGGVACVTCHQANGEGLAPSFPPLKGAGEFYGDCVQHAGYVVNGLQGEVEILGKKYNSAMPAQAKLSDLEIAAVISYERQSWGNEDGFCLPKHAKEARGS